MAPESPSSATYTADAYIGGLDHISISKVGADCAGVSLAHPMSSSDSWSKITTPSAWGVPGATFGACGDAGATVQAKGAVGTLVLHARETECLADLHVTLFAFSDEGTVKTSRLDVDDLVIPTFPAGFCQ